MQSFIHSLKGGKSNSIFFFFTLSYPVHSSAIFLLLSTDIHTCTHIKKKKKCTYMCV